MKKMSKKAVSLALLVALCVVSLSGCKTAGSGTDSDTFLIGGIGPLTGTNATYGISVKQAAQLAIENING